MRPYLPSWLGSEEVAHHRKKVLCCEGLLQVVRLTQLEALLGDDVVGVPGHEKRDDLCSPGTQAIVQFLPGHPRHHDVGYEQINLVHLICIPIQCVEAGFRNENVVAMPS